MAGKACCCLDSPGGRDASAEKFGRPSGRSFGESSNGETMAFTSSSMGAARFYKPESSRSTAVRRGLIYKLAFVYISLLLDLAASTWATPARADTLAFHLLGEL